MHTIFVLHVAIFKKVVYHLQSGGLYLGLFRLQHNGGPAFSVKRRLLDYH